VASKAHDPLVIEPLLPSGDEPDPATAGAAGWTEDDVLYDISESIASSFGSFR